MDVVRGHPEHAMNLRQLQYFSEVSRLQSVSRAAMTLRVAQPALTRHVHALERELGVELFIRQGRGITLTQAGAVFNDRVKAVLRDLDRARIEARALARSPGRRVDVGLPLSLSQALTSSLTERARRDIPDVSIRVLDGWTGFIIEWLMSGRLDVGVIYDHTLKSDVLQTEPLAAEEHFLVCAPGSRFARKSSVTVRELSAVSLALPSRLHGLRIAVENHFATARQPLNIDIEVESITGLRDLAAAGATQTILPRGEIETDLQLGRLAAVRLSPKLHRHLFIAWSNERPVSLEMTEVRKIIRRETARLVRDRRWGTTYFEAPA